MFEFLAGVLAELYKLWPSFGGAIILFTALIMVVLSPLSIKSTRSMIAMQRVGPEVKKLQQKHKGDREALNREMMAFYQEHNINPFSSCLPLLLQFPVFIVLYRVLLGLTRRVDSGDPTSNFNPKYFEGQNTPLAVALRGTNKMVSFGMDLSQSVVAELRSEGLVVALPFLVLVVLVVGTAIVQQRQIQGRNPAASANPQQQMIAKVMPFIFVPISVSIPAGVVIYFVVSNLVRIGQQALVTRLEFRGGPPQPGDVAMAKKSPPKLPKGKAPGKAPTGKGKDGTKSRDGAKGGAGANGKANNAENAKTRASKTRASKTRASKDTPGKARDTLGKARGAGKAKGNSPGWDAAGNGRRPTGKANGRGSNGTTNGNAKAEGGSRSNGRQSENGGTPTPAPRPRKRKRKRR